MVKNICIVYALYDIHILCKPLSGFYCYPKYMYKSYNMYNNKIYILIIRRIDDNDDDILDDYASDYADDDTI